MTSGEKFSLERLNAYVDGELDVQEQGEVLDALRGDEQLAREVCELVYLRGQMSEAYRDPPQPVRAERYGWRARREIPAIAAAALVVLGLALGWSIRDAATPESGAATVAQVGTQDTRRVVLHIATDDRQRVAAALDEAERLLREGAAQATKVRLEVVANAEGMDLLRADATPFADRIRQLTAAYDNITFLACNRAIKRLQERGVRVRLVPEAVRIPGALEEVVTRLQQGWTYVKA